MDSKYRKWNLKELYENDKAAEMKLRKIEIKLQKQEYIVSDEQRNSFLKEVQKINLYYTLLHYVQSTCDYYIEMMDISKAIYWKIYYKFQKNEENRKEMHFFEIRQNLEEKYYELLFNALVGRSIEKYNEVMMYGKRNERRKEYKYFWEKIETKKDEFYMILIKTVTIDKQNYNFIEEKNGYDNAYKIVYKQIKSISDQLSDLYQTLLKEKIKLIGGNKIEQFDLHIKREQSIFKFSFEEGERVIKEALKILGTEYQNFLNQVYNEDWIDSEKGVTKIKGSYCFFLQDIHPFIMVNYDDSLDSLLELSHEIGHGAKKYFSNEAEEGLSEEIPAIVNEMLVLDYLAKSKYETREKMVFIKKEKVLKEVIRLLIELEFIEKVYTLPLSTINIRTVESIWLDIQKNIMVSFYRKINMVG